MGKNYILLIFIFFNENFWKNTVKALIDISEMKTEI